MAWAFPCWSKPQPPDSVTALLNCWYLHINCDVWVQWAGFWSCQLLFPLPPSLAPPSFPLNPICLSALSLSLSLSLSHSFCLCLSLCLSLTLSLCLSVSVRLSAFLLTPFCLPPLHFILLVPSPPAPPPPPLSLSLYHHYYPRSPSSLRFVFCQSPKHPCTATLCRGWVRDC